MSHDCDHMITCGQTMNSPLLSRNEHCIQLTSGQNLWFGVFGIREAQPLCYCWDAPIEGALLAWLWLMPQKVGRPVNSHCCVTNKMCGLPKISALTFSGLNHSVCGLQSSYVEPTFWLCSSRGSKLFRKLHPCTV